MLLLELNAPEHVLETINFQTLTAFWWVLCIVEISICYFIQGLIAQVWSQKFLYCWGWPWTPNSSVQELELQAHTPTPNLMVDFCRCQRLCWDHRQYFAEISGLLVKWGKSQVELWCFDVFHCKVYMCLLYFNLWFWIFFFFSNTFHILRPTKAPGFVYAWLELISHRIFIARMLAHTPQQKVWLQFISYRWSL